MGVSGEVYFVMIRDFHHKRKLSEVISWLQENVVLGQGEAEKVDSALPFEIPMGFPSKEEAKEFTQKLELMGCIIGVESLSERKARAEKAAQAAVEAELAAEAPKSAEPKAASGKKKGERKKPKKAEVREEKDEGEAAAKPWVKPLLIGVAALLLIALSLLFMRGEEDGGSSAKDFLKLPDFSMLDDIRSQSSSGSPFSEVVGNMQRHIEQQQYSQEERVGYSKGYGGAVEGAKPVMNRKVRRRNIMLLQASIGFYRENAKSWKRLVAEYQAIGATLKVEELRKEMVEIFGEAETAEILEENG